LVSDSVLILRSGVFALYFRFYIHIHSFIDRFSCHRAAATLDIRDLLRVDLIRLQVLPLSYIALKWAAHDVENVRSERRLASPICGHCDG
jgi:hypothetical protein